jgi:glutamate---cysteine ligase / carboxylate-amine ligase
MPLEPFKASDSLTMGVELELQLVNTYDMDLSSSANDLLELLGASRFRASSRPR